MATSGTTGGGRGGRSSSTGRHGRRESVSPGRRETTYVVKKTVRDVGGASYPMLTRTNYAEWAVMMKVMLKARGLFAAVTTGPADEQEDQMAMEAILKAVPPELVTPLGSAEDATAKKAWDKIKTLRLGDDRVRKARAQQLRREYENISYCDGEAVEEFGMRLSGMVNQLAVLGDTISESEAVAKFLRVVPAKFAQVAISIETLLDFGDLTIEDVTGRLKAVEDRIDAAAGARSTLTGQVLLTQEEWEARARERKTGEGSSVPRSGGGGGARGKPRGKGKKKGGKARPNDTCHNCGKTGHWARDCKEPRRQEKAHLAREDEEEPALLMAEVCALSVEAEEAPRVRVELDETRAQVHLGREDDEVEQKWYLDSGASSHMTGNRNAFSELDIGYAGTVKFGDNSVVEVRGRGTVLFHCQTGEHRALTEVYYIPKLRSNIVSIGQLDERGCRVLIDDGVLRIHDRERKLLAKVNRSKNRLYVLDVRIARPVCLAARHNDEAWRWHARFGHLSFEALASMARQDMVRGLPLIEHVGELCDSCLAGKQRRLPFPKKANYRADDLLELVHGDLCGPITPATHGGRRFFLLLVDDCSRFMWLHLLSSKDEAAAAIKVFKALVEKETGKKLKVLRTDRGGEFTSIEFGQFCAEEGVERHLSAPYSPQQNGVVERRNQTVVGMARCMLKAKGMPAAFWGEAVSTAVFILNRAPTKSLKGKTPFEAWHGYKPDVSFLRTFGCVGHVKKTKPFLSKLEDRSSPMVLLGYEHGSKAYRMYDPEAHKVVLSRDVVFDEAASWKWEEQEEGGEIAAGSFSTFTIEYAEQCGVEVQEHSEQEEEEVPSPGAGSPVSAPGAHSPLPAGQENSAATGNVPSTPTPAPSPAGQGTHAATPGSSSSTASSASSIRFATPPLNVADHVDDSYEGEELRFRRVDNIIGDDTPPGFAERELEEELELHLGSAEEPPSFEAAEQEPQWRKAMLEEMAAIEENGTWKLVNPPIGCQPISLKWVYKVKRDEHGEIVRHKARLVARGFVQREGIDFKEVFAPVARMESVRMLLALAAAKDWQIHHMDVKSAFLNGELTEEIYVQQPPGFAVAGEEHKVLRLRKALYGLRQAPRAWNIKLDASLTSLGFTRSPSEHALYIKTTAHGRLIVGVYVDDLIITGSDQRDIDDFKGEMKTMFRMSDLGLLTYYLGIEVEQGRDAITLKQSAYARKLLERSGMTECKAYPTPMEEKIKLSKKSTAPKVDATEYRSLVGGLRYLVHTRPDIAFSVGYVSRFMEDPREDHLVAVKRLLRYVAGTIGHGLAYARGGETPKLMGYSDSDMAGDLDGRRSTAGIIFFLGSRPITWQSQKQEVVALSTCEAEYVAASMACCQGVWLGRLLRELTGEEAPAPALRVDNQSAISLAKNPVLHNRSKHIETKFHYIRHCVDGGRIRLEYVVTGRQLGDIFTKPLGRIRFLEMKTKIGVEEV
ncbi:unnamed protein product [Urochloa humidicola]